MAETNDYLNKPAAKSAHALREEKILAFWKDKGIFEKSLKQTEGGKEFVFYEGPPTANGRPGIHHIEARAFKDAIPRYKTMQGFHVRRKGGWDTHGLPVEIQVEKELGFKSKKEIDQYGIAAFNEKCKESVWTYVHEWEQFTDRLGYWVDLRHPYITYKPAYIEALWGIMKHVHAQDLLYKDFRVVPWCPHDQTVLSSHELAQGYETVKDLSVYVKFEIRNPGKIRNPNSEIRSKSETENTNTPGKTYLLAWTTTPWTLPGNVALAVGEKIEYVTVKIDGSNDLLTLAKERLFVLKDAKYQVISTLKGKDLIGLEYEPLYPFLKDNISGPEKEKLGNAFEVYAADFVTTTDGTGIVHTAVMYGQDDFELGTKVGLPKYHLVNEDGTFKNETGFLAGKFVKDEGTDVEIIKDLAGRGLLFAKEKYEHTYPFCWRCHTPLIYYARDSWYIKMSALRHKLVKENEGINWEPEHIKEGRFGEWLREVKDWAISRERYWGTPLPVWVCEKCKKWKVVGSVEEVSQKPKNAYYVMRHGEAENNVSGMLNGGDLNRYHLTQNGKDQVKKTVLLLKNKKIAVIYTSPVLRAKETASIVKETLELKDSQVIEDQRLHEVNFGAFNEKPAEEYFKAFPWKDRFENTPVGAEKYGDIKRRVGDLIYELEKKHVGENILIITHGTPSMMLMAAAQGLDRSQSIDLEMNGYIEKAEARKLDFTILPHNPEYELDLHRPYIDQVKLGCSCGGEMTRVKEVMDVWFDSGSMPFAQDHMLKSEIRNPKSEESQDERGFSFRSILHGEPKYYPADFISEAIDQTRGWFYTLHAVGALMGKGKAYKNVVCLGHILDAEGKKMSKSIGNVVDPWLMMDTYGADALRFWMYSVNQPGDSKNFDPKTVDEVNKKVFNLAANVLSFYKMYAEDASKSEIRNPKSETNSKYEIQNSTYVLDQWIIARLNQLIETVTEGLDAYKFFEPTRSIRDFVADLSQWYLRRSRDRFKGDDAADRSAALATTQHVLITLAKTMAPFSPFFAEYLYQGAGGDLESVHLEDWPEAGNIDTRLVKDMEKIRVLASNGLVGRTFAKINVRQPLKRLAIQDVQYKDLSPALFEILKDEINVKEIVFDEHMEKGFMLDTTITPELKEEGDLRELMRKIQDLRKENGLTVNDKAVLIATDDMADMIKKNEAAIKKATNLGAVEFGATFSLKRL